MRQGLGGGAAAPLRRALFVEGSETRSCAVDQAFAAQGIQDRQQWQTENREVFAADFPEQVDTQTFQLVAADAVQRRGATCGQVPTDESGAEIAHGQVSGVHMLPDHLPVTGQNGSRMQMVGFFPRS
jgi:hypothetical protein